MNSPKDAEQENLDGMPSDFLGRRSRLESRALFIILLLIGVFTAIDIATDVGEGATFGHLAGEGGVTIFSIAGAAILWRRSQFLSRQVVKNQTLANQAEQGRKQALEEARKWRQEASSVMRGLSDAIDEQLTKWKLTNAEKEVALLLLKGLSLKEIASLRSVAEKTARAESFAIYSKSNLAGRAELSAFFLEDLMLPSKTD